MTKHPFILITANKICDVTEQNQVMVTFVLLHADNEGTQEKIGHCALQGTYMYLARDKMNLFFKNSLLRNTSGLSIFLRRHEYHHNRIIFVWSVFFYSNPDIFKQCLNVMPTILVANCHLEHTLISGVSSSIDAMI